MMQKYGAIVVSVMVVASFGSVLGIWLLRPTNIQGANTEVINILLGTLASSFVSVCNYWLGSSSGSKSKDDTIQTMATK